MTHPHTAAVKSVRKPTTKFATLPRAKAGFNPKPKAKNLEQQKTDFTAEGSPPPGKVDVNPPATVVTSDKAVSPAFIEK